MSSGGGTSGGSGNDLVDKFRSVNWRGLGRNISNKVKQYAMNLSPLEVQVEEATNLDTWGPHGSVMAEICESCFDPEGYRQVLGVIARRLQEKEERWRMAYKALLLLEYLIKHGPEKVWRDVQQSSSVLQRLTRFEYVDANQRDHGVNVRHRAQEIQDLVNNEDRVREERRKAAENKAKYSGYSASQMRMGAVSSGSQSSMNHGSARMTGFGSQPENDASQTPPQGHFQSYSRPASSFSPTRSQHVHAGGELALGGQQEVTLDPISATQARIASMKLSNKELNYDDPVEESKPPKKKLSDVRANPKIAASLGLKVAPAPASKAVSGPHKHGAGASHGAKGTDILEEAKALTTSDTWDPFGGAAATGEKATAFDPFTALDAPAAVAPPAESSDSQDPFAALQAQTSLATRSEDPFAGLDNPETGLRATSKEKDPFADLLL